jgi:hypothetical protein
LNRFYLEDESNNNDKELESYFKFFMECGFNRIVLVEGDNPSKYFVSQLTESIRHMKDQGNNLQISDIGLYKRNIEIIKYVRDNKPDNSISLVYELLSHIKMLEKKSKDVNSL